MSAWPRVGVVGGSLGGLTAALVLRDLGCEVDVWERSTAELESRGAGIVVLDETLRYLRERTSIRDDDVTIATSILRYLDAAARSCTSVRSPTATPAGTRSTARCSARWIRRAITSARRRRGSSPRAMRCRTLGRRRCAGRPARLRGRDRVVGSPAAAARRVARVRRVRGLARDGRRGAHGRATLAALADAVVYQVIPESHILVYPIPNVDGATAPGRRLLNFVWYRNYPGAALDRLMTDREGVRRDTRSRLDRRSRPRGGDASVRRVPSRAAARGGRAGRDEPFVQAVFDIEVPRMAFGRTCLIGDAAFALRPHIAAGTAKAASDGWALADALEAAGCDVPAALELGGAAARCRTRRARAIPAQRRAGRRSSGRGGRKTLISTRVARPAAVTAGEQRAFGSDDLPDELRELREVPRSKTAWHPPAYASMIESDVFQSGRGSGLNQ